MRVTEVTKRDHVVDNIQRSSGKLQDIQIQMASGRRLNKTSDDPIGAARSQDIVTTLSSQKQQLQNVEDNIAWLQRSELEIGHINENIGANSYSCYFTGRQRFKRRNQANGGSGVCCGPENFI